MQVGRVQVQSADVLPEDGKGRAPLGLGFARSH